MDYPQESQQVLKAPRSQKLPCPGSVLLGVAMNLSLKLLPDMVEPGAVEKAMSSVVGRCGTPAASTRNRMSEVVEVGPGNIVATEELGEQ